jgi:hypothetical protein
MAAEAVVIDLVKSGSPSAKAFGEARLEMMRRIAELGQRVRARRAGA